MHKTSHTFILIFEHLFFTVYFIIVGIGKNYILFINVS